MDAFFMENISVIIVTTYNQTIARVKLSNAQKNR